MHGKPRKTGFSLRCRHSRIWTSPISARECEWVTVIESIGTNNYVIPPFVIFKGKKIQQAWIDAATDPRMAIAVGENGWTD